jgi:DNA polymerase II small subunit/DNA polymerase delta subunit B
VEGFSTENKPQMLVIGHFHTSFQAFIRNVYVMHPSSFQGQTPFLRRMALFPVIGGYHIKVEIGDRGIARLQFEFIPLYKPLAKDY